MLPSLMTKSGQGGTHSATAGFVMRGAAAVYAAKQNLILNSFRALHLSQQPGSLNARSTSLLS